MTTSKEQEAFSLVVERQKSSASENDIRNAFQRSSNHGNGWSC